MCGQPPVIISGCVFEEMLLEMKKTRLNLILLLAQSEDSLSKLYNMRETSIGLELMKQPYKEE